jgi:exodeoxyribonuclease V gamma subunit
VTTFTVASWDILCERVAAFLGELPADPFTAQTLLVPSLGHGRALAQYVAATRARGQAITAGVDFVTPAGLYRRASSGDGSWKTTGLAQVIATALTDASRQVTPDRLVSESLRVARLFRRYLTHCPDILSAWEAGDDVSATGALLETSQRWQPAVWRRVVAVLGPPPSAAAAAATVAPDSPVGVVLVDGGATSTWNLIAALADTKPVSLWRYNPVPPSSSGDIAIRRYLPPEHPAAFALLRDSPPPATPLRQSSDSPPSLLAAVQAHVAGLSLSSHPSPPLADGSLQLHLSHGPSRQVEVLREVLTGALADDPTLEPRDVLVLTSDLATYAPLIQAVFHPASGGHPGRQLRVRLAANQLSCPNAPLELLLRVLRLPMERCESAELLDIAAQPQVAARFGFDAPALVRLRELITDAGVIWGLDAAHRAQFGLSGTRQSTWFAGVERLSVSALQSPTAVSAPPPTLPVASVETQDLPLIGALAELVSRLRRAVATNATPATFNAWRERLLTQLDWLSAPSTPNDTTLTEARALLATLGNSPATPHDTPEPRNDHTASVGVSHAPQVEAADLAGLLSRLAGGIRGRPSYHNGSLTVTQLGDLTAVAYDVVVLLGIDDDQWPRRTPVDPDDLTPPNVSSAERADARWQLLAALLAARKRFVAITKGLDPVTNRPLADPLALRDLRRLIAACGVSDTEVLRRHPLQPHEWSDFVGYGQEPPFSFDTDALRGALAAEQRPVPIPPHWDVPLPFPAGYRAPDSPERVELADLEAFFANPARELLGAHGIRLTRWESEPRRELPLELDPLARYQVGQLLLDETMAGVPLETSLQRIRLAGLVAPGESGGAQLRAIIPQVQRIAERVAAYRGPTERVRVDIDDGVFRLGGSLCTWGGKLLEWRFGSVKATQLARMWLRLLALVVARPDTPAMGAVLGRGAATYLRAPAAAQAAQLLGDALRLGRAGLTRLVPLPVETAAAWVGLDAHYRKAPQVAAAEAWLGNAFRAIPGEATAPERPEWAYFFPAQSFDELLRPEPLPDDPADPRRSSAVAAPQGHSVSDSPHRSRFDVLAHWFWQPVLAARVSASEFGGTHG